MKALAGLSLLVLLNTSPVAALDKNGNYELYDYNYLASCSAYLEHIKVTDQTRLRTLAAWIRGYMTGFNQGKLGKKDFFKVGGEAVLASWLLLWCQLNPASTPHKGLLKFINDRKM